MIRRCIKNIRGDAYASPSLMLWRLIDSVIVVALHDHVYLVYAFGP